VQRCNIAHPSCKSACEPSGIIHLAVTRPEREKACPKEPAAILTRLLTRQRSSEFVILLSCPLTPLTRIASKYTYKPVASD
jgi:hypothetical protein